MNIPKCTMCGGDIDLEQDNNVEGICDDGAEYYAHMICAEKGYDKNIDYKSETTKDVLTYFKPTIYN